MSPETLQRPKGPSLFRGRSLMFIAILFGAALAFAQVPQIPWAVHDMNRPQPPVVTPGPAGPPVPAPGDAVVLFGGQDLAGWTDAKGQPAKWKVENGYFEV